MQNIDSADPHLERSLPKPSNYPLQTSKKGEEHS